MLSARALVLVVAVLGAGCASQQANQFDGAWSGMCGMPMDFVLHGQSGRAAPHIDPLAVASAASACTAPVPVLVQFEPPAQVTLVVKGSDAGASCPDTTVSLKRMDSIHLEGVRLLNGARSSCRLTRR